jgi:hypothetical protein
MIGHVHGFERQINNYYEADAVDWAVSMRRDDKQAESGAGSGKREAGSGSKTKFVRVAKGFERRRISDIAFAAFSNSYRKSVVFYQVTPKPAV